MTTNTSIICEAVIYSNNQRQGWEIGDVVKKLSGFSLIITDSALGVGVMVKNSPTKAMKFRKKNLLLGES